MRRRRLRTSERLTMADDELATIDWTRPWLAPWRERGEPLARRARERGVAAALDAAAGAAAPVAGADRPRFVPHEALPPGEGYEAFIGRTGCVPTRPNLHDFFNGLVWLERPVLKWHLNARQLAHGAARAGPRGPARDVLTLFDENGAWLSLPPVLAAALAARDWQALFVHHRAAWAEARVCLVGHALLEKLVRPRPAIVAHAWLVAPGEPGDGLARFEATVDVARRAGACFMPLPVLGVPGWWPANADPGFYADATVFRPDRPAPPAAE